MEWFPYWWAYGKSGRRCSSLWGWISCDQWRSYAIKQAHPIASSLNRCAFPTHPNQQYIPKNVPETRNNVFNLSFTLCRAPSEVPLKWSTKTGHHAYTGESATDQPQLFHEPASTLAPHLAASLFTITSHYTHR